VGPRAPSATRELRQPRTRRRAFHPSLPGPYPMRSPSRWSLHPLSTLYHPRTSRKPLAARPSSRRSSTRVCQCHKSPFTHPSPAHLLLCAAAAGARAGRGCIRGRARGAADADRLAHGPHHCVSAGGSEERQRRGESAEPESSLSPCPECVGPLSLTLSLSRLTLSVGPLSLSPCPECVGPPPLSLSLSLSLSRLTLSVGPLSLSLSLSLSRLTLSVGPLSLSLSLSLSFVGGRGRRGAWRAGAHRRRDGAAAGGSHGASCMRGW
jgi:hypothetical protein